MIRPDTTAIPQQSVYLEVGGNGLIYSLNYDVLFNDNWGFRLGGAYFPYDFQDDQYHNESRNSTAFIGLIMATRAFGRDKHKLEVGGGFLFGKVYNPKSWDFIRPPGATFSMGYRFYPSDPNRFTFKASFTPVITRSGLHPRFGISVGITLTPEGDADLF